MAEAADAHALHGVQSDGPVGGGRDDDLAGLSEVLQPAIKAHSEAWEAALGVETGHVLAENVAGAHDDGHLMQLHLLR